MRAKCLKNLEHFLKTATKNMIALILTLPKNILDGELILFKVDSERTVKRPDTNQSKAYSEPCQTSKLECFTKIAND